MVFSRFLFYNFQLFLVNKINFINSHFEFYYLIGNVIINVCKYEIQNNNLLSLVLMILLIFLE